MFESAIASTPVLLLLSIALASALVAATLAYLLFARRRSHARPDASASRPARRTVVPGADSPTRAPAPAGGVSAHSLFVIFSSPDSDTRQALFGWLRQVEARYDSVLEVYSVAGKQPANPVKIANAFPPGTLPDLLTGKESEDFELRGLSLLVKPPLRRSRNQQMHVFIEFARALEALGGEVLDANRQPATEETYARILG